LRFKYDIGDLVVFQTPHMDIREWNNPKAVPYQTGMITFREKAGWRYCQDFRSVRNSYYHILLPSGETRYLQREDRLALVAKANP
jgi:hypothetical protein